MEKQHWSEVTQQNTQDIAEIKGDIKTIKDNHLHHIELDTVSYTHLTLPTKRIV